MNDKIFVHRSPFKILEIDTTEARANEKYTIDGKDVTGHYLTVLSYPYAMSTGSFLIRINDPYSQPLYLSDFEVLHIPEGIKALYITNVASVMPKSTMRIMVSDTMEPIVNPMQYMINNTLTAMLVNVKGAGSPGFIENVTLTGVNRTCKNENIFYVYPHGINTLYDNTFYLGQTIGYKTKLTTPFFELDPEANILYVSQHFTTVPPFDALRFLEKTVSTKYGSCIIGDSETDNSFITVVSRIAGSIGEVFTFVCETAATPNASLEAAIDEDYIVTVTLGTDALGDPDPAKNTATLVAAALEAITVGGSQIVDATPDGTGNGEITDQALTVLTGANDLYVRFYVYSDYKYQTDEEVSYLDDPDKLIETTDWILLSDLPAAGTDFKLNFYAIELMGDLTTNDRIRFLCIGSY